MVALARKPLSRSFVPLLRVFHCSFVSCVSKSTIFVLTWAHLGELCVCDLISAFHQWKSRLDGYPPSSFLCSRSAFRVAPRHFYISGEWAKRIAAKEISSVFHRVVLLIASRNFPAATIAANTFSGARAHWGDYFWMIKASKCECLGEKFSLGLYNKIGIYFVQTSSSQF